MLGKTAFIIYQLSFLEYKLATKQYWMEPNWEELSGNLKVFERLLRATAYSVERRKEAARNKFKKWEEVKPGEIIMSPKQCLLSLCRKLVKK